MTSGTGTAGDPYVIEGWEIANPASELCIRVEYTKAHFIIRDVYVHGARNTGIWVCDSGNCTIENAEISSNYYGVRVVRSSQVEVRDCNFSSNSQMGLWLYESSNATVSDNRFVGNGQWGCDISPASDVSVLNNFFFNNWRALGVGASRASVTNNTIISCRYDGMGIGGAKDSFFSGNKISRANAVGVMVTHSTNLSVENNAVTRCNDSGVELYQSNSVVLKDNSISHNSVGLRVQSSTTCPYHNDFIGNTLQAKGIGASVVWDDGYPSGGNYWSDYLGSDDNGDGIGDTPYISDNVHDRYPLMLQYTAPSFESIRFDTLTDKPSYVTRQPVNISLRVLNCGDLPVILNFEDDCTAYFVAEDLASGSVFNLSIHESHTPQPTSMVIQPGECAYSNFSWNQRNDSGDYVPPRTSYLITGVIPSLGHSFLQSSRIKIEAMAVDWVIDCGVLTNKSVYLPGESIAVQVSATNHYDEPMDIHFASYPQVWYLMYDNQGKLVSRPPGAFLMVVTTVTIQPGGTHYWNFTWNQKDAQGSQVPWPAYYRVSIGATGYLPNLEDAYMAITDINHLNPEFSLSSADIRIGEILGVDASASRNVINSTDGLQYRWDWEGDGVWDTGWMTESVASHVYLSPGDYTLRLEIKDPLGAVMVEEKSLLVSAEAIPEFPLAVACVSLLALVIISIRFLFNANDQR